MCERLRAQPGSQAISKHGQLARDALYVRTLRRHEGRVGSPTVPVLDRGRDRSVRQHRHLGIRSIRVLRATARLHADRPDSGAPGACT